MSMSAVLNNINKYPSGTSLQIITRHYYERNISIASDARMESTVNLSISLADRYTGAMISCMCFSLVSTSTNQISIFITIDRSTLT